MDYFPPALEALVEQFAKLPGIGRKSAQRLAFHILGQPEQTAKDFAQALLNAKSAIAHSAGNARFVCPEDRAFVPLVLHIREHLIAVHRRLAFCVVKHLDKFLSGDFLAHKFC